MRHQQAYFRGLEMQRVWNEATTRGYAQGMQVGFSRGFEEGRCVGRAEGRAERVWEGMSIQR